MKRIIGLIGVLLSCFIFTRFLQISSLEQSNQLNNAMMDLPYQRMIIPMASDEQEIREMINFIIDFSVNHDVVFRYSVVNTHYYAGNIELIEKRIPLVTQTRYLDFRSPKEMGFYSSRDKNAEGYLYVYPGDILEIRSLNQINDSSSITGIYFIASDNENDFNQFIQQFQLKFENIVLES